MKTRTQTFLAAVFLLAISCKKENTTIPSPGITGESSTQDLITDINEPGAVAVRIGTQVWMTKNLSVAHYRNGDSIPQVKDPARWEALTTGAWCWYNDNPAMGKLYNWYAVNDPRGLAPAGWHVPSDAEWTTLSIFLGGDAVAGGEMKETGTNKEGTGLWRFPNTSATNSSGFTALPGGYRYFNGAFYSIVRYGYWWSSTEFNTSYAWLRKLSYSNGTVFRVSYNKHSGYSVRCLKD